MEHFRPLAADMGKSGLRRLIWSILGPWPQIRAKVASEGSLGAFLGPWPQIWVKVASEARLDHVGRLAADMDE